MSDNSTFDVGTVIEQAIKVISNPLGFYRDMNKSGGYSEPVIFLLVMAVASGLVTALLAMINLLPVPVGAGLGMIIILPIAALIGGFIGAAILFVVWKLMGSTESYETAYRCVAYTSAIMPIVTVLSVIPYLGTLVRVVWGTYLIISASIRVHNREKNTSYIVFGILGALGLLMSINAERAQREMASNMEQYSRAMEESMKDLGEMTPEEAGRAVGEFMKGMEDAAREAEQSATE
jgi:hypothetical protein